jgi:uncharacterized protein YqjF (DUF2071 family)
VRRPFLTAQWRHLAMLNWEVAPEILEPLVPPGTELDSHAGSYLLSIVGLLFVGTRVHGLSIPFHTDFEEVNLRFYVRREVDGEVRRAVVFVRELVPLPAVALTARLAYGERYSTLPMRSRVLRDEVSYEWRLDGRWQGLSLEAEGPEVLPGPGSEEEFVSEHYWGYASGRRGTVEYRVEHSQWPVRPARVVRLDCDAERLYGRGFAAALDRPPRSAFLAAGSAVTVWPGDQLARGPIRPAPGRPGPQPR